MNRILVAILLSLAVHGVLLCCRFGWPPPASMVNDQVRVITVQLPDAPPLPPAKIVAAPVTKGTAIQQPRLRPPHTLAASQPRTAVSTTKPVASEAPNIDHNPPTTQVASLQVQEAAPPQGNILTDNKAATREESQLAYPLYRENQPPGYPPIARKQRYQGTTELAVLVTKDGTADDLRLQNSSGHPVLDQAAMAAVRNWKFAPGRQGAEPVAMWVTVPIRFELQ